MRTLAGTFRPGTTFDNGVTHLITTIPLAGAATHRIRAKVADFGATISVFFLRPDGTRYESNNPGDLVLVADTENWLDIDCAGEQEAELDLLGAGVGSILYVDVMQAPL